MLSSSLWQNGPAWLTLSRKHWPTWSAATNLLTQSLLTLEPAPDRIETRPTLIYGIHCIIDVARFSRLDRLIRVTSYVLRFIGQLRKRTLPKQVPLTVQETIAAETKWIQSCQQSTYAAELTHLISKNKPRTTLMKQLQLFLDDQRLIRCHGRIHNAPVSESSKFPLLLPANHPFTKLVFLSIHHQQVHSGVNSTLTAVRQRFWIPRARQLL